MTEDFVLRLPQDFTQEEHKSALKYANSPMS